MFKTLCRLFFALGGVMALACPAHAWEAYLEDIPGLPSSLVVVDKSDKRLFCFEKHSPLTLRRAFPSIYGQEEGDKFTEGDMRTPEGVYFVTGRIGASLDFGEYGSQAHGLNYPNPVDRLRGKTGYGIWIHSKGQPIANQRTKGCIAIDLADIDVLAPHLVPGTAVIVAENVYSPAIPGTIVDEAPRIGVAEKETTANELRSLTVAWNQAWASRSSDMFDFYDGSSYTLAQNESFAAFKAQKENLFKRFDWIRIFHGDVHVLEGPGYWVTWFEQHYSAPNMTTEGVRRLYWMRNKAGVFKIVGMEWLPQNLDMKTTYLARITPGINAFIESWRDAWERGDVEAYGKFYARDAIQESRRGVASIVEQKQRIWAVKKPKTVNLNSMRIQLADTGVRVDMTQIYRDSSGYQDKGVKELILYPDGDSWRIASGKLDFLVKRVGRGFGHDPFSGEREATCQGR